VGRFEREELPFEEDIVRAGEQNAWTDDDEDDYKEEDGMVKLRSPWFSSTSSLNSSEVESALSQGPLWMANSRLKKVVR